MWSGFSSEIETFRTLLQWYRWQGRMWSGFSSEIETTRSQSRIRSGSSVACGAASRLRLKQCANLREADSISSRMWSGFSSEIETRFTCYLATRPLFVACGAASRLRLKPAWQLWDCWCCGVACGAASRLRLKHRMTNGGMAASGGRMWSGFSSEIETSRSHKPEERRGKSHVERLLV